MKNFADGEVSIKINDKVRGKDVYIVHSVCRNKDSSRSVNDALMELLLVIAFTLTRCFMKEFLPSHLTSTYHLAAFYCFSQLVTAMRRSSAASITAIIPYFGYARQDRKLGSRVPISAADVSLLISTVGTDRVVAVDLHCGQIQGFFPPNVPVDNLAAANIGVTHAHTLLSPSFVALPFPIKPPAFRAQCISL